LQRYFGISEFLNKSSAKKIYEQCNEQLKNDSTRVQQLLQKMNVQYVGTTDDPLDDLQYHQAIKQSDFQIKVLPSFRPDKAIAINNVADFTIYLKKLEQVAGIKIDDFDSYTAALKSRHDYFSANGCTVSDHGVEKLYAESYTHSELAAIFKLVQKGEQPDNVAIAKFKSAMLTLLAEWGFEKNWVQQYHMGPIRNNNSRMFKQLGADTGWDSIGNAVDLQSVSSFLDRLDARGKLAKTILYSINPNDNDALATMVGNFNDGSFPGKVQLGAAWWFNDQMDGMINHLKSVGNMGLLSRFVGMLTDSRSFLSFPRHEYFRRILCNFLGEEMKKGRLPNDEKWIGSIVQDICYNNAKHYFDL
jgi:glucuronate isomerase